MNDPSRSPLIGCILGGWFTAYNNTIPIPIATVVIRSQLYIDEDLLPDWLSFSPVIVHIVLGFPLYPSLQNGNCDNKYGTGLLFTIANVMCDSSHTNIFRNIRFSCFWIKEQNRIEHNEPLVPCGENCTSQLTVFWNPFKKINHIILQRVCPLRRQIQLFPARAASCWNNEETNQEGRLVSPANLPNLQMESGWVSFFPPAGPRFPL